MGIYAEMGATFKVIHGRQVHPGEMYQAVYLRPEHVEIKLYEYRRGEDAAVVIEDEIEAQACPDGPERCPEPIYVNIKFHENNFYSNGTTWWPVFYEDAQKTQPLDPPFDLDASEGVVGFKPPEIQSNLWALYEGAVQYAVDHPERFRVINMTMLADEI